MTIEECIDEAALAHLASVDGRWQKVAMVYAKVTDAMGSTFPEGAAGQLLFDERIETLVESGRLEARGDIKLWRHSEVRLAWM